MEERIKGKNIIITGSSKGIGRSIAISLAKEGANLCLAARGKDALDQAAKEIRDKFKVDVLAVPTDVSQQKDLENLINSSIKHFKKIDCLINNAGVSSQHPFQDQPLEDIQKLMFTNYFGYVMATRLIINHFIENKGGAIINMVSGSTLCDPLPRNFIVYSSLKVGLKAFFKGLFWEVRDYGIKITSLMPGVTDTDLTGKLKDITEEQKSRLMSTEAIEKAVIFALTVPANVCPLELQIINQQTPWTKPVIPFEQKHPDK